MGSFNGVLFDDNMWEILKDNEGNPHIHLKLSAVPENGDISKMQMPPFGVFDYVFKDLPITRGPSSFPKGSNTNGQKVTVSTRYAFSGCDKLIEGSMVPDTTVNQDGQYEGCKSLKDAKNISQSCSTMNAYAADCRSLESIARIPDSVKEAESALENCSFLKGFEGGKNIENAKGMCAGCSSMIMISPDLNPEAVLDDFMTGTQLDKMTFINEKDEDDKKKNRESVRAINRDAMTEELVSSIEGMSDLQQHFGNV